MRVLALADDLTGALEVGAQFASYRFRTRVHLAPPNRHGIDEDVLVLDTETRHLDPGEAARIAGRCVRRYPAEWVYKKTDSTLRGNIGAELSGIAYVRPEPIAYVPAYPALGRTVREGCLFVDGAPLAETAFARDPLNPVSDSRIRAVLPAGMECTIFDGDCEEDIERAAAREEFRIFAGPAAIARALAARLGGPRAAGDWPRVRTCLVVNGSAHPASERQIDTAADQGWLDEWWRFFPMDAVETGPRIRQALTDQEYDALLVFGGDTAFRICRALRCSVLEPMGEVLPGVPISRLDGRRELLITKAGGFGGPGLIGELRKELHALG